MKKKVLHYISINPFLFDSTLMIGGGVLLGVCNYLFTVVMAHVFSLSEFGEFQVYASTIALLGVIGSAPTYYATRLATWASEEKEKSELVEILQVYSKYRLRVLIYMSIGISCIVGGVFLITRTTGNALFVLTVIAVVCNVLASFFAGIVQGVKQFTRFNLINVVSTFLKIIVAGTIGYITHSPTLALGGFIISQLYSLFFFEHISKATLQSQKETPPINTQVHFSKTLIRELMGTFLFSLGLVVLTSGDVVLARLVLTPSLLGSMSIFLIVGKIVLFANLALMGVVLSYAPQGTSEKQSGKSIVPLAYLITGTIGIVGTAAFFLMPQFILHVLFHVPTGSFLEPILWRAGIIELFLSLICLEANISFGRKVQKVPYILCAIAFVFCMSIYFGGHSVSSLTKTMTIVYGLGWLTLCLYRLIRSSFFA